MPLVTIDLQRGRPASEIDEIADAVHEALVESLDVPRRDRFQIISEHDPGTLRFDRGYLDIPRSDAFVLIRVTMSAGRTTEAKQAFYASVARRLADRPGIAAEDVAIMLVQNMREDWSFGRGQASYVELPREQWR
jgi:phenylpyruvate tautomerase PptA (4-oxalocrotonate tautomerase family)